jgi:hypothetical protein
VHMRKLILITTVLLFTQVNAQNSKLGNWFIYFGNQSFRTNWNWHNEIQYRNYNFAGDLEQLLVRTGIGYNLTPKNNNVLFGYGYIRSENYVNGESTKRITEEHRIFQQFITKQNFGRFYLTHRYRIEERFVGDNFRLRFRYFFGLNIPINGKEMQPRVFYFSAYNELFVNSENDVFDRDRWYFALGYNITNNLRVEAGFMEQMLSNRARNQLQIVLYNSIPFRTRNDQ